MINRHPTRFPAALAPLFLALCSLPTFGEEDAALAEKFQFHTPETWKSEVILLPPRFAPDLDWHGVESIRFAPGMFQPDSESFFSYLLVFLIGADDDVSETTVHEQILVYYRGLARAVMGGRGIPVDTDSFKLNLESGDPGEGSPHPVDAGEGQVTFWTATLDWIEPFATRRPQALHFEVHLWKNGDRPVLYFTVSPQERDHPIWKEMRGYREKFTLSPG